MEVVVWDGLPLWLARLLWFHMKERVWLRAMAAGSPKQKNPFCLHSVSLSAGPFISRALVRLKVKSVTQATRSVESGCLGLAGREWENSHERTGEGERWMELSRTHLTASIGLAFCLQLVNPSLHFTTSLESSIICFSYLLFVLCNRFVFDWLFTVFMTL